MAQERTEAPRDKARQADYYQQIVAAERAAIDHILSYNNARLFLQLPPRFLHLSSALYSTGATRSAVVAHLADAATYEERYIREAKNYHDDAYRDMEEYLDIFGAAALSDRGQSLVEAFRRTTFDEEPPTQDEMIIRQLCALVAGEPSKPAKGDEAAAKRLSKGWKTLPPLLSATAAGDAKAFGTALEAYLTTLWGPPTETWAKAALKSAEPKYHGKWSFFSAALCQLAGTIPPLSEKALRYVPVDLVASARSR